MRTWLTLLLLLSSAWPAMAVKPMSVDQVEQLLARLQGKPDGKVARELEGVQLTERVSRARLARWQAEFPGAHAQEELIALADLSVFLDLPESDLLRDPPPDTETERHILWTAEQYAGTISHLPNFTVLRETTHFAESISSPSHLEMFQGKTAGLQPAGVFSRIVTYRDGREIPDEAADKQGREPAPGLAVDSEFGPMITRILKDALENQVSFERWEQGPSDPAAVFRYEVPERASHFEVNTATGNQAEMAHPAYRGEIEIDPETGAILRLSEIADMRPPYEEERAEAEVTYVPVTIGSGSYIFPVKAVIFSRLPAPPQTCSAAEPCRGSSAAAAPVNAWPIETHLNDVTYTHYHESPSEHTIVVGGASGK